MQPFASPQLVRFISIEPRLYEKPWYQIASASGMNTRDPWSWYVTMRLLRGPPHPWPPTSLPFGRWTPQSGFRAVTVHVSPDGIAPTSVPPGCPIHSRTGPACARSWMTVRPHVSPTRIRPGSDELVTTFEPL